MAKHIDYSKYDERGFRKDRTKEYVAKAAVGTVIVGGGAALLKADNPKKPKGLSGRNAGRIKRVQGRLVNYHRLYSALARQEAFSTGKYKKTLGYNPKSGRMVREQAFDEKRFNQLDRSYKTGKPQANTELDREGARFGRRVRRIDRAGENPKNKKIVNMGKALNLVRASSVLGILSYVGSSTPVGNAQLDDTDYSDYKIKFDKK